SGEPPSHRALYACRCGHDRLPLYGRGSNDLHSLVDRGRALPEDRRADVRVRVSRRQLRDGRDSERCAFRGGQMRYQSATLLFAASLMAAVGTATPVRAHHAFAAEFDSTQPITLRGSVTRVEWINPHTWIHLDVKDSSGKVIEWMI